MNNDSHSQEDEVIEILRAIRDRSREAADICDAASHFESNPNRVHFDDYKEYLRNFLIGEELPLSFTDWIDRYFNPSRYIRGDRSPIFGRTFQLNLCSDDFLKGSFTDIFNSPATEKVMVVCSFISKDGKRNFATYTLDTFGANIDSFMKYGRLSLNDPNFIDESNVLDNVSDGPEGYFPRLHLMRQ